MTGVALTVTHEGGTPARLVFDGDRVVIGRARTNEICLPDPRVSARHVEVLRFERGWWVQDLGSANGTRLNGQLLAARLERVLHDGDVLDVAGIRILVELEVPTDAGTVVTTALTGRRLVRQVLGRLHPRDGLPRLEVVSGPDSGRSTPVETEVRIGRAEHCELALTDALVSREHAVVRRDLAGLMIIDLGSSNRIRVGDEVVQGDRRIQDGDEIRLGNTRILTSDPTDALVDELELLPDEIWESPQPELASVRSPPKVELGRSRRFGWEWLAVLTALAAMGGAAYLIYVLAAGS